MSIIYWSQRTKQLKFILLYSVRIFTLNIDFFLLIILLHIHCSHAINFEDFIIFVIPESDAGKCINERHRIKQIISRFQGREKDHFDSYKTTD